MKLIKVITLTLLTWLSFMGIVCFPSLDNLLIDFMIKLFFLVLCMTFGILWLEESRKGDK